MLSRRSGSLFQIVVEGNYSRDEVRIRLSDETVASNAQLEAAARGVWESRAKWATENGVSLFSADLCRLVDWKQVSNSLELTVARTTYRELVETNLLSTVDVRNFEERYLSNALAVCSVLRTSDARLLIQRRSEHVHTHSGYYHLCGGQVDWAENPKDLSPFLATQKELEEELGIARDAIGRCTCIGMVRDESTRKPEIGFETFVRVSSADLSMVRGPEHDRLIFVKDAPDSLYEFLTTNLAQIVPVGMGVLMLYGKRKYGASWFDGVCAAIAT